MRTLPFPLSLVSSLRSSATLIRATAMDAAVLAGHVVLYPTGLAQERPVPAPVPRADTKAGTATGTGTGPGAEAETDPGGVSAAPPRLPGAGRGQRPVVLLHGFIDNRSVFVLLRRSLRRHGRHHVEALNYSPMTCDIRAAAELLGEHVEGLCARSGHGQVDLVGHSLGGLIARYYVQRLGGHSRVATLVTLGTPHGGTRAAPLLSAHPLVRQMRPDSEVIEELRRPAPGCATRFVSFWSDVDQVVTPIEMACVDHPDLRSRNVRVTGIGHLALPVHPAVVQGVRMSLEETGHGAEQETAQDPEDASGSASVA
ncbi:triacylglycerol lipase [Streptomyces sp. XD-27]|uniref:esterase/lipase family protein n=1 Tax=Streptomyces sp. XD-27 TaxID=3062779 RepID=UPI0026F45F4A|nr:alpha/beta fold hydrolase [Streptomyces sp. XD-27]WKX70891.1 alpha/beta fold hydrolase [Streptomyces sp. XD-27]